MEQIASLIRQRAIGKICPESSTCDGETWIEKQARWENEMDGKLTGPHCEKCRDKGYIAVVQDGCIVHRNCECMDRRRSIQRIEKSGLKSLLDRYTFATYETLEPWQQHAKELALRFLDDYDRKWFIASGVPGSGKTHICTAICGALMGHGMDTRYMLWRSDSTRLKAVINDPEEYGRLIDPLKTAKVLYIDDFWKSGRDEKGNLKITVADVNLAFDLLNDRYNDPKKITIISTELLISDILDVDVAVGSRIYERGKEYCLQIRGKEKNWRLRA